MYYFWTYKDGVLKKIGWAVSFLDLAYYLPLCLWSIELLKKTGLIFQRYLWRKIDWVIGMVLFISQFLWFSFLTFKLNFYLTVAPFWKLMLLLQTWTEWWQNFQMEVYMFSLEKTQFWAFVFVAEWIKFLVFSISTGFTFLIIRRFQCVHIMLIVCSRTII